MPWTLTTRYIHLVFFFFLTLYRYFNFQVMWLLEFSPMEIRLLSKKCTKAFKQGKQILTGSVIQIK